MLCFGADQPAKFVETRFIVNMFVQVAEVYDFRRGFRLNKAAFAVHMFGFSTDQPVKFIKASFSMGMLVQAAEIFHFRRCFRLYQTVFIVDMLCFGTNQPAQFVETRFIVNMFCNAAEIYSFVFFRRICCVSFRRHIRCSRIIRLNAGLNRRINGNFCRRLNAGLNRRINAGFHRRFNSRFSRRFHSCFNYRFRSGFNARSYRRFHSGFFRNCIKQIVFFIENLQFIFSQLGVRIYGHYTVANNLFIVFFVFTRRNPVAGIAFDGGNLIAPCGYDAHMIGKFIFIPIKKDQITPLGFITVRFHIHAPLFKGSYPFLAAGSRGHAFHFGITDAEGCKHRAPIIIWHAIPIAVAGIALDGFAIFKHNIILFALPVSQLGFGDGNHILRPIAGQFDIGKSPLPFRFFFHIRFLVGIANQRMRMFFACTVQFPYAVTHFRMGMTFAFIQAAVRCRRIAGVGVNMLLFFGDRACQNLRIFAFLHAAYFHAQQFAAFRGMHMAFTFNKTAFQYAFIAVFAVYMVFCCRADQFRCGIAAFPMHMFIQRAGIFAVIAGVAVHMPFLSVADQFRRRITSFAMHMILRKRTEQFFTLSIACFAVNMGLHFFHAADQSARLHRIAAVAMLMARLEDIAFLRMAVIPRFFRTDQPIFYGIRYLNIAMRAMAVFFHAAESILFLGNCRKDQRVSGAENNNTTQKAHQLTPYALPAVLFVVCFCFFQKRSIHQFSSFVK